MTTTFNVKSLGELVAHALGLQPGDDVEIARDRLNPMRLLVVRSPVNNGDVSDAKIGSGASEL